MGQLTGKIAVVTGGASGIGWATAAAFAERGAKVVIADVQEEAGKTAEERLLGQGADVYFIPANVADENSVRHLMEETINKYARIDIMVSNAGVGSPGAAHELAYEDYRKVIGVNQDGVFYCAKYAVLEMLKTGQGGCIVNTASILGHVGVTGALAYNASKGAVLTMTKSMALDYAKHNIRVNAVCPGYVETGMVNRTSRAETYDELVRRHPLGRLGRPEDIAHAIVFLCENEFVTGTSLVVDGGYMAQ